MKAKEKIKKIKKILKRAEDFDCLVADEIESIIYDWDDREEDTGFDAGDAVTVVSDDVLGYEFRVIESFVSKGSEVTDNEGLEGQIKIETWVEPEDIKRL